METTTVENKVKTLKGVDFKSRRDEILIKVIALDGKKVVLTNTRLMCLDRLAPRPFTKEKLEVVELKMPDDFDYSRYEILDSKPIKKEIKNSKNIELVCSWNKEVALVKVLDGQGVVTEVTILPCSVW